MSWTGPCFLPQERVPYANDPREYLFAYKMEENLSRAQSRHSKEQQMRILPIFTISSIALLVAATAANAQMSNGSQGTMGPGMSNNMMHRHSMMHKKMHKKMSHSHMMMKKNNM
jgi:hypothetical protein